MNLQGKTVLVTGATGGSAPALVGAVAETGARLALTGRDEARLAALQQDLGLEREQVLLHTADLTDPAEVEGLVAVVNARWGGVDVLLNWAGGWGGGERLADVRVADWDAVLGRNLRVAFLVCRAVLPYMVERGWGRIVNVASRAAESPGARQAAYNVAKAGVVALTASIAADYARRGVVANAISPSVIDTAENRAQMPNADYSRWVTPEQLAAMALYLCRDEAGALNGANIPLYGRM